MESCITASSPALGGQGAAPLHRAVLTRPAEYSASLVTTLLAQHGADVNLPAAFDGATPLDIAHAKNNQAAVQLLSSMSGVCRKRLLER